MLAARINYKSQTRRTFNFRSCSLLLFFFFFFLFVKLYRISGNLPVNLECDRRAEQLEPSRQTSDQVSSCTGKCQTVNWWTKGKHENMALLPTDQNDSSL